ncbi:MAG: efflux RND transporter periplasmic adaptor subunit [Patescibacteria group bacterium]|nr:efflux RND transporter periplasmic adaptor subunit [Patescibacteria group bacterium]
MKKTKIVIFGLVLASVLLAVPLLTPIIKSEKIAVSSQEEEEEPLLFPGTVTAEKQVALKFKTSGKLAWVGVKEEDFVKKGQTIASLDKTELEKTFKKEINDYLSERWDFEQTQDDYRETKDRYLVTNTIKRILEKAQFDLENSVLDLEIAKLAVEYAAITTPIDGIVTQIDEPVPGVNITPATAVFTISDPDSIYFKAEADEEEVASIKEGQKGKIVLDAYPDQEFASTIISIGFAPMSSKTSTAYAVKMSLPENTDLRFRLGMNGEVEME